MSPVAVEVDARFDKLDERLNRFENSTGRLGGVNLNFWLAAR